MSRILSPPAWALVGALAFYALWDPIPEVRYDTVVVTRTQIEEREPQVELRFVDRIRYVEVAPEVVAESPDGGELDVAGFCAEAVQAALEEVQPPDTPLRPPPPSALLLRSGSLDAGWLWQPDRLTLTGPLSSGGLQQQDYRVRGSFSFVVDGDRVVVRQGRAWWVREVLEAGAWVGLGYLAGRAF